MTDPLAPDVSEPSRPNSAPNGSETGAEVAPRWRQLSDEDRQREYSPSSCTGGSFDQFIDQYVEQSESARVAAGAGLQVISYGLTESQTIDLVVPTPAGDARVPIVVYIHGGYWQALSKRESFFAATDAVANGWAFAAVDYTLTPYASLDEIVAECRAAVTTLRDRAAELGFDAAQMFVCGSSAGGHLSAMLGLGVDDGWRPAGVGLISGVFELEPLIDTSINDAVQLDVEAAGRNSPLLADLTGFPPAVLAWGDNETDEFKRQSKTLRLLLEQAGTPVREIEIAGRNHFDVVLDLCRTSTPLGAAIADLVNCSTAG